VPSSIIWLVRAQTCSSRLIPPGLGLPLAAWARRFMVRPGLAAALASGSVTNARVISMTAYYGDAELMSRLLRVEGRGLAWDEIAPGVLERAAAGS
jgi:hypothetical protein